MAAYGWLLKGNDGTAGISYVNLDQLQSNKNNYTNESLLLGLKQLEIQPPKEFTTESIKNYRNGNTAFGFFNLNSEFNLLEIVETLQLTRITTNCPIIAKKYSFLSPDICKPSRTSNVKSEAINKLKQFLFSKFDIQDQTDDLRNSGFNSNPSQNNTGNSSTIFQSEERFQNKRMKISRSVLYYLSLEPIKSAKLDKICKTSTAMGQRRLYYEISKPLISIKSINQRIKFIEENKSNNSAINLKRVLKDCPDFYKLKKKYNFLETLLGEKIMKRRPLCQLPICENSEAVSVITKESFNSTQNTGLSCDSEFQKSVGAFISDKFYDIPSCLSALEIVVYLKSIINILESLKTEIFKSNLNYKCFRKTLEILNKSKIDKLKKKLNKFTNDKFTFQEYIIHNPLSLLVKSKIDSDLDLVVSIYEANIEECQNLLLKLTENNQYRIYKDKCHGICLKYPLVADNKKKNNKIENASVFNLMKSLKSLKSSTNTSKSSCTVKNDLKNEESMFISSNIEPTLNQSVIILSIKKKYILFTTCDLQVLNYKISQTLNQIIEISGKICMKNLINLSNEIKSLIKIEKINW